MLTGKYRQGEQGRKEGFGGRVFQAEDSQHRTAILDTLLAVAGVMLLRILADGIVGMVDSKAYNEIADRVRRDLHGQYFRVGHSQGEFSNASRPVAQLVGSLHARWVLLL